MHARQTILQTLKAQLKTANYFPVVLNQRVLPARIQYPAVTFYAENEDVETALVHPVRVQERVLNVSIVVWLRGSANDEKPETDMDKAAEVVEKAVVLFGGIDDIKLLSTDFTVDEDEPEIHAVSLNYQISYCVDEGTPSL